MEKDKVIIIETKLTMGLSPEEIADIIAYRIEKSSQALKEAKDNTALGNWSLVVNRLYYAVFYLTLALNLKNQGALRTHNDIYHYFNMAYIATGILSKEESQLYQQLYSMHRSDDIDDLFDWTEEDVLPLIKPVENFLNKMRELA